MCACTYGVFGCVFERMEVRVCMLRKMLAAQQEKTTKEDKLRAREREGESIVRERRDYSKLVANAKTCTILQCQAHKAATCPTKTKVNGADDCELGLDPDPGYHD